MALEDSFIQLVSNAGSSAVTAYLLIKYFGLKLDRIDNNVTRLCEHKRGQKKN